jgi:hypothetical protein
MFYVIFTVVRRIDVLAIVLLPVCMLSLYVLYRHYPAEV